MKYDIYQGDTFVYSTDASASLLHKQLRAGEQVALAGSEERLTEQQWAELVASDTGATGTPARAITYWGLRKRFTPAERIVLEWAALDDPGAEHSVRQSAAAVRVYLADAAAARWIDLDDGDTRAGVQALEAMGLLAKGRAIEILDAPLRAVEAAMA